MNEEFLNPVRSQEDFEQAQKKQTSNWVKLTNAVYKILEYFPESDPLKNRAKDKALLIMENLVSINEVEGWISFSKEKTKIIVSEEIDILLGYLWIGKTQKWLNSANYMIIVNEYEKIKKALKPAINFEKIVAQENVVKESKIIEDVVTATPPILENKKVENTKKEIASVLINTEASKMASISIPPRQEKIIDFLGKNEKAQVMDLQKILPDVTKRTIRRDLDELMESGKIVRMGDFNQIFYKLRVLYS